MTKLIRKLVLLIVFVNLYAITPQKSIEAYYDGTYLCLNGYLWYSQYYNSDKFIPVYYKRKNSYGIDNINVRCKIKTIKGILKDTKQIEVLDR